MKYQFALYFVNTTWNSRLSVWSHRRSGGRQHSSPEHPAYRGATWWEGQHHQSGLELSPRPPRRKWRSEEGWPTGAGGRVTTPGAKPLDSTWPGHLSASISYLLLRHFSRTHSPPSQNLILEDSVRNKKINIKRSASYDEKREKMKTLLIWALLTALFCFFIPHCLPAMYPFDVYFTVVLKEGSSETQLN